MIRRLIAGGLFATMFSAGLLSAGWWTAGHAATETPRATAGLPSQRLTSQDIARAERAFEAIAKEQWSRAHDVAAEADSRVLRDLVRWFDYARPQTDASFDAIAAFFEQHGDWPHSDLLQRRAEEKMPLDLAPERVAAWFERHPPVSVDGANRLIAAYQALGRDDDAVALIRRTWIEGAFGKAQESAFLRRHRKLLRTSDHVDRLERLIWSDYPITATRMLLRVPADVRRLAQARLKLMQRIPGVDAAIARVPKELRSHEGLVYERVRWRRRKGRDADARELLLDEAPTASENATEWWTERAILARRALRDGFVTDAYRLASGHGLEDGSDFAEAEWLSGWIALRFLEEPKAALKHFEALYGHVSYPVSLSRAAYWAGRAAEAGGDKETAMDWYGAAARHTTSYYGQLAGARVSPGSLSTLPEPIKADADERAAFAGHSLVAAMRILAAADQQHRMLPFALALDRAGSGPGWRALSAELSQELGRPDLGIFVAKRALNEDHLHLEAAYPVLDLARQSGPEPSLLHALIRQESAFSPVARSSVGASGLMQLMPRTAEEVARQNGLKYSHRRLTSDPEYNITLGSAYLQGLLERFDGSYVLAISSYNAGPYRTKQWIEEFGDPRDPKVDTVDWVEMIPFSETRNYVQRVLENLQVYRQQLQDAQVAMTLADDLERAQAR